MKWSLFAAGALAGVSSHALAAGAPTVTEVAPVEVIAMTPLSSGDASRIAAPVQTITAGQLARSNALDLTAYMNRELAGVYVNDVQNNPLQPDINYRGYTASPLLGTPQGLSLYMDGVRLNQPFGDVVSWDLIPKAAISSVTLAPGSNPLFGLNTLGGALSIRTKDGRTAPGMSAQLSGGSYNRYQGEVEIGGKAENGVHWYATANHFTDHGWRENSPSEASQLFGKVGWSNGRTDLSVTAAYAYTDLTGNGLQEQRFLDRDYRSVFTKPDNTKNQSLLLNFTAGHKLTDSLSFSGNAYLRTIDTKTFNGDVNDESLTESIYQPSAGERTALTAAGYSGFPTAGETALNTPFPSWRCIANALLNAVPSEKCDGLLNRSTDDQRDAGVAGQLVYDGRLGEMANQITVGAAYVSSSAHFLQSSQYGYLAPDRSVVGVKGPGAFADGKQASENAQDARVDLAGHTRTWSLYFTDSLAITPALNLTVSGRYDTTEVRNRDALTPTGAGSLTGNHDFSRFNPAVGLTYNPTKSFGAWLGYNESSRAPSAIELGCADPANPCRLPNALAGDPPLKQVVAHTVEGGIRGKAMGRLNWRAGVFRSENHDDILFVAAPSASSFGYFRNFGQTRRQGVEVSASTYIGPVTLSANYTWLKATYQTREVVGGVGNSTNSIGAGFEGNITILPGNHIPLVPENVFKAGAQWDVVQIKGLSVDVDVIAVSGVYARGNENNRHQPDGVFYIGPGKTDGYAVANLGAQYQVNPVVKLFLQVNNLLDKQYATSAQLGLTGFTNAGAFFARQFAAPVVNGERPVLGATFYGPGAPRMIWGGIEVSF